MNLPEYREGSIVNLMASLLEGLGAPRGIYLPTPLLPPAEVAQARNVVLVVIDGLGLSFLLRRAFPLACRDGLRGALTSVFPATTASAMTSFLTGTAPQQHGLTGWFMYFRELGAVTRVLPFQARFARGSLSRDGLDAARLFGHRSVFEQVGVRSYHVLPAWIAESDFTRAHSGPARVLPARHLAEFLNRVRSAVRDGSARKFVLAYWPDLDAMAHRYGVESPEVQAHLLELDRGLKGLRGLLAGTGTVMVVTADHGLVDSRAERTVRLASHPDLERMLVLPLCGEPRVAYAYLHPGREAEFTAYAAERLGHCAQVLPSTELVRQGAFGLGEPHPRLAERVGHYTLVMRDDYVIRDRILGEDEPYMVGVHGGTSQAEMEVPLMVFYP